VSDNREVVGEIADAILDGNQIDWAAAESTAGADDRAVLAELRHIAAIAGVHRAQDGSDPEVVPSEAPATWGHLKVGACIGRGAFGRVYRAWDTRLDREVALKLIPDRSTNSTTSIIEEGRLLARVRHPNVVTIYGAERLDGYVGLWMELLEGNTLQMLVSGGRTFDAEEVIRLGIEVCRAVAAVHHAGLLHRDITAQNVMIAADGGVVLMDFGTGRETADPARRTLAGTPLYLAPEVFLDRQPADIKSEVYSIGVLLYFLLTGTHPVTAETIDGLREAHRAGAMTKLRHLRPDVPRRLADVIERAIDRDPERRYESAEALGAALARGTMRRAVLSIGWPVAALVAVALVAGAVLSWTYFRPPRPQAPTTQPIHSLLILPLDNKSTSGDFDYLSAGLTDGVTTELSKRESLRVLSPTTARQVKRAQMPLDQLRRMFGVDAVLRGSLTARGTHLHVEAQLVRLHPEAEVWRKTYDNDLSNAFVVQTDLARAVAAATQENSSSTSTPGAATRTIRPDAFDAYLRARYYESGAAGLATERAIEMYRQAVALDPTFTAARAGLARAYIFGVGVRPSQALATARATAVEATRVAPGAPETDFASAVTRLYAERDFYAAEQDFVRALAADAGNADAHFYFSHCLVAMGRFDEALAEAERARSLDPLSPLIAHYIGRIHYFARRYEKALAALNEALDIDPNYAFTHIFIAATYERMGRFDQATEHRQTYLSLIGGSPEEVAALGRVMRRSGYNGVLLKWAETAIAQVNRRGYLTSSEIALVYAQLGRIDDGIGWLKRAVDEGTRDLIYLKVEPGFDPLRRDPRFDQLVAVAIR
jgi:serine/threonine protein kinase/tetratricopeptide (TPR) repeat protein